MAQSPREESSRNGITGREKPVMFTAFAQMAVNVLVTAYGLDSFGFS